MSTLSNSPVHHLSEKVLPKDFIKARTRILTHPSMPISKNDGKVYYWVQRDMRVEDNWALLLAAHFSNSKNMPLRVVYALPPPPSAGGDGIPTLDEMPMTARHGKFLLDGLESMHQELGKMNIPLQIVTPESYETVGCAVVEAMKDAAVVVADFNPLRHARTWMELQALPLLEKNEAPFYQVDAHNVVPVWTAAGHRQVGARTLRPRIQKVLGTYLQDYPALMVEKNSQEKCPAFERSKYEKYLDMDESVAPVDWAVGGSEAGWKEYERFVKEGLSKYDTLRNDPNQDKVCSNLSPWVNHGHISFQTVALKTKKLNKYANASASFMEEGIIRRELSDNYVYYEPNAYDSLEAAAGWARETLEVHSSDKREYLYTLKELEEGKTHDELWNAAQLQVVREGGMHGFMRMYWAKKVLQWSESPEVALRAAQYFNDKYALDGKDPNGFVGVGWSVMGIHDQGWKEREVFGKIRFMNYNGCKRK